MAGKKEALKRCLDTTTESATYKRPRVADSPPPPSPLAKRISPSKQKPRRLYASTPKGSPIEQAGPLRLRERISPPPQQVVRREKGQPSRRQQAEEQPRYSRKEDRRVLDDVYRRLRSLTDILQRHVQESVAAPFQDHSRIPNSIEVDEGLHDTDDAGVELPDDDAEWDWLLASPQSSNSLGHVIDTRPSPGIQRSPERPRSPAHSLATPPTKPQRVPTKYAGHNRPKAK